VQVAFEHAFGLIFVRSQPAITGHSAMQPGMTPELAALLVLVLPLLLA
jgi:hypothetical protein